MGETQNTGAPTNPTGRDELVERVARALIEPLGYSAGVDWERTWVGNECDDVETGSLAYLCRTLARAAITTIEASRNDGWQPIETAPRDAEVLVCVTFNLPDDEWETKQWVDSWFEDGWSVWADRIDIPFPPTHWRPLPEPPSALSHQKGDDHD